MRQLFNWRFVAAVAAVALLALLARAILADDSSIEAVIEPAVVDPANLLEEAVDVGLQHAQQALQTLRIKPHLSGRGKGKFGHNAR